jgi:two-component system sensor histidine kinase ChvG
VLFRSAELLAGAAGELAAPDGGEERRLEPELARQLVRRLGTTLRARVRLFDSAGDPIADSRMLSGPAGQIQIVMLPPPSSGGSVGAAIGTLYDWVIGRLPGRDDLPVYRERPLQDADDYPETVRALGGDYGNAIRTTVDGMLSISVAVPVQHYKQVLGAVMLTADDGTIDDALRGVRLAVLEALAGAVLVTVLMSMWLARGIARPLRMLARAAERIRPGRGAQGRRQVIPDLTSRDDEIGDLSGALRDMTDALRRRVDATEAFAADVAHEIKNPLSSLRSAVETVTRLEDPAQRARLLAIIVDDVQRLDRLITDISDASRLDAELSRAEPEMVDLAAVLAALVEVYGATAIPGQRAPEMVVGPKSMEGAPVVFGVADRLVQVFRNLIANAQSFNPPGGGIRIGVHTERGHAVVTVDDDGPGVPESEREAIFERFYSRRPKTEQFGRHSGLGLSISRQIVEAHGGSIVAGNRLDASGRVSGAQFTVRLPLAAE